MINIVEFLVRMSKKEHSVPERTLATLLGATLFLAGIPALVFWIGRVSMSQPISPVLPAHLVSGICFVLGLPWLAWAIFWQLIKGKGTPVPVVPTKHFLQDGPYRFVRNPMMLGFFFTFLAAPYIGTVGVPLRQP